MPPNVTAILSLPLIQNDQAQKHVTHNEALQALDALVLPVVEDRGRTVPPVQSAEGDRHLIGVAATGAWAGHDHAMAVFTGGGWTMYPPRVGWRIHVRTEAADAVFDGSAWALDGGQDPDTLGINADADTTNRLAVAAPATLLSHEGAGHQVKVNKAGAGETNAVLFQTDWSGRAEMGCAGSDDFSIKVSADGEAWIEGLGIDAATGAVRVSQLVLEGLVGVDNYVGRSAGYPGGSPQGMNSGDFLVTGGINNDFVLASNSNSGSEGIVMGHLAPGTNVFTEQMRLDTIAGRLGIGTPAPTATLHVAGPVRLGTSPQADLPPAADVGPGSLLFVPDAAAGPSLAYSDGSTWRMLTGA